MGKHIVAHRKAGARDTATVRVPSRGQELRLVRACLRDASDCALLVQQAQQVAPLSPHSYRFTMRGAATCLWLMHEVVSCIAWQMEGEGGIAITF